MPFVQQLQAFGMTIAAGMAAGLVFDLYRLTRRGLKPRGGTAWLIDLLFWLVVTPVVFSLLLLGNWGELRFYVVVGLTAGAVLYFGLLSNLCLHLAAGTIWWIGRVILLVGHLIVRGLMVPVMLWRVLAGFTVPRRGWYRPPWGGWAPGWRAFGRRI